jgi:hypothetical protein
MIFIIDGLDIPVIVDHLAENELRSLYNRSYKNPVEYSPYPWKS